MALPKTKSLMRGALTLFLLGAFQIALFWLFQFEVPESNRDLVVFMLGQLSGFTGAGVAYYLGSSQATTDQAELWKQDRDWNYLPDRDAPPFDQGREMPRPDFGSDTSDLEGMTR